MRGLWTALLTTAVLLGLSAGLWAQTDKLVQDLKSPQSTARRLAALKLGSMGEKAAGAVDELARVLRTDKATEVRQTCAVALGMLGKTAQPAVAKLAAAATDDAEPKVRAEAALSLGKVAPESPLALKTLRTAAKDADPTVSAAAADTLRRLGK